MMGKFRTLTYMIIFIQLCIYGYLYIKSKYEKSRNKKKFKIILVLLVLSYLSPFVIILLKIIFSYN